MTDVVFGSEVYVGGSLGREIYVGGEFGKRDKGSEFKKLSSLRNRGSKLSDGCL